MRLRAILQDKSIPWFIFFSLLLAVCFSCSQHHNDTLLARASDCMQENPDSALLTLNKIESTSLHGPQRKALYSLLLTQARYRTGEDITSDSLLRPAISYFIEEKRGTPEQRFLTLYYQGEILRESGNNLEAILKFEEADNIARNLADNFYLPKMLTSMCVAYAALDDYPDELATANRAAEIYRLRRDTAGMYWADFQRALSLISNLKFNESMKILDSLEIKYPNLNHSQIDNINTTKADIFFKTGEFSKAYPLFAHAYSCPQTDLNSIGLGQYAMVLTHLCKSDSARIVLNQLRSLSQTNQDREVFHQFMAICLMNEADYKNASLHYDSLLKVDSIVTHNLQNNNVIRVQRNINKEKIMAAEEQISMQNILIALLCLCAATLIICLMVIVRYYRIRKEKLEEEKISMAMRMNEEIKDLTSKISEYKKSADLNQFVDQNNPDKKAISLDETTNYINYLRRQNKELDSLLKSYFSGINKEQTKNIVYNELESLLSYLVSDTGIKRLTDIINESSGNVIQNIKVDFNFSDKDIKIILFTLYGLSYSTIANILNENERTLSSKKTRLIKKILTTSTPHTSQYTKIFSK